MTKFYLRDIPTYETIRKFQARFPDIDPSAQEVVLMLLHVCSEIMGAMGNRLGKENLSSARFTILMLLGRYQTEGLLPSEIAEKMGVTRATITGLLNGLERDDLVKRLSDSSDRRAVHVHITDDGTEILERLLPGHFKFIAGFMAGMEEPERKELVRLLSKVREGLEDVGAVTATDAEEQGDGQEC